MKQRRGPLGPIGGLADSISGAVRRRNERRSPRVVLYDAAGHPELLGADTTGHAELVETAGKLVAVAEAEPPAAEEPPPGRRGEE